MFHGNFIHALIASQEFQVLTYVSRKPSETRCGTQVNPCGSGGGLRTGWVIICEYPVVRTLKGIIIHSTDRLVAQLIKTFAKTRYKDTYPEVALANLGGTVILEHYNEIINVY